MSVIQKIQDKYAKLMAVIIAVALIIFVVMLAFENGGRLFQGGNTTTVGKVNGDAIEFNDFQRKVDQQEAYISQQQYGGNMSGPALQQQAVDAAWSQEINAALQNSELRKLGITVGKREMGDVLYGPDAPDDLKNNPRFKDEATGVYNGLLAKQEIDQVLKLKSGTAQQMQYREQLISFINYQQTNRASEKYNSLFANSVNIPKWQIEKENADRSQMARISVVKDSYAANTDSTIKVTDKEIEEYLDKHKDDYKQEESRSIAYVAFSALPTAADSAIAYNKVLTLKPEFDTTHNVEAFLSRNASTVPYSNVYAGKSMMQMANKDTIQKLAINEVYGPYLDGSTYTLAKMLDIKQMPDSVKSRHILLGTADRQGNPLMDDSVAHAKADSIALAIKNGANFDTLETKYTSDEASHREKGVMTISSMDLQTRFAPEYTQFVLFDGKPGDKKVVKTQFGWHYIEIMSFIKVEPHYKVAYMAKSIEVGSETDNNANNLASQFAGDSRDQKSFDANAEKLKAQGINRNIAVDIRPLSYEVQGLGFKRSFVKRIYEADRGEVLDPEKVGDNYVVAIVTEINKEGRLPLAKARPMIEPLLKNKKVAEKLKQKIGKLTTLEAAAAALGGKPIEVADSLRMTNNQNNNAAMTVIAGESKVIGAAFNPANKGKVVPEVIEGASGVYVVRVDDVTATPVPDANVPEQRKARYMQGKQQALYRSPLQALRDAATIKDNRARFY
jgi:peptidyl-prolyl cis-trans isomerase D